MRSVKEDVAVSGYQVPKDSMVIVSLPNILKRVRLGTLYSLPPHTHTSCCTPVACSYGHLSAYKLTQCVFVCFVLTSLQYGSLT